ncbi:MAG: hypothetical protein QM790_05910 [Nibricoccus sp.]
MKLKHLAFIVCVSQALHLGIRAWNLWSTRNYGSFSALNVSGVLLEAPLAVFFFYFWKRGGISDEPENLLKLSASSNTEINAEEPARPSALFALSSVGAPILAFAIAWAINAAYPSKTIDLVPIEVIRLFGFLLVGAFAGTVFSILSLWRRERWPLVAILSLAINGGFLLGGFHHAFR